MSRLKVSSTLETNSVSTKKSSPSLSRRSRRTTSVLKKEKVKRKKSERLLNGILEGEDRRGQRRGGRGGFGGRGRGRGGRG